MTVRTCAGCSTQYALDLDACPHCGSSEAVEEGVVVSRRLPSFVSVECAGCARRWNLRLPVVQSGLIELPVLFCTSCGRQVQVPWPPVEDDMPKNHADRGPTNARADETSPVVAASEPLAGAEAGRGHSTSVLVGEAGPELADTASPAAVVEVPDGESGGEEDAVDLTVETVDYESLTLAELKDLAASREVAAYGTKAQIAERLREADQEG